MANTDRSSEHVFDTPKACTIARDARALNPSYGKKKRGERQLRCEACKRWCFLTDRCNLFTTAKVDYE